MVKAPQITGNKGMITLAWLLSTAGFGILLGGVASLQSACSANMLNQLTLGATHSIGYLAPVSCSHFFQFTWFITFLHFFAWALVLGYLLGNVLYKTRPALVGLLAVTAVLLILTANTYLMFNYIPGLSGIVIPRLRTLVAGAIIAAIADLLLLLLIGWADDKTTAKERGEYGHGPAPGTYTAVPVGQATTTTTSGTVPVSTNV